MADGAASHNHKPQRMQGGPAVSTLEAGLIIGWHHWSALAAGF